MSWYEAGPKRGKWRGRIYIYIDHSNVWIQGRKEYSKKLGTENEPTWRYDVAKLKAILLEECDVLVEPGEKNVFANLYASTPPPLDAFCHALGNQNIKVIKFDRCPNTNREKKVDGQLIADSVNDAAEEFFFKQHSRASIPDVVHFVIVSGDADIRPAVSKIEVNQGIITHVWSWSNALASEYRYISRDEDPEGNIIVHELDKHLDTISFRNYQWQGSIHDIPKYSAVVLDGECRQVKIEEFLISTGRPYRRYTIKYDETRRLMTELESQDLVIIDGRETDSNLNEQQSFYNFCYDNFTQPGLRVMTFMEYYQQYLGKERPGSRRTSFRVSNRFSPLPDNMKSK